MVHQDLENTGVGGDESLIEPITEKAAASLASRIFGVSASAQRLPGERDLNFKLIEFSHDSNPLVIPRETLLKISHPEESLEALQLQIQVLNFLHSKMQDSSLNLALPQHCQASNGSSSVTVITQQGSIRRVRLLTYIPGQTLTSVERRSSSLLKSIGRCLGKIDQVLTEFSCPSVLLEGSRGSKWDLRQASWVSKNLDEIKNLDQRKRVEKFLKCYREEVEPRWSLFRMSIIHGDANDHNIIVGNIVGNNDLKMKGLIDFGDVVLSYPICELAIAIAYSIMNQEDPLAAAVPVVAGYHEVFPLTESEVEVLFILICTRLCVSVVNSAREKRIHPENSYLNVSEDAAWKLLEKLEAIDPKVAYTHFREACGWAASKTISPKNICKETILKLRSDHIGKSLRLSYREPLHLVRGFMQYLFDSEGRRYLDAINNVSHVGHCHPKVVKAGQDQMARLNTNTRYLHEHLVSYAESLSSLLPSPLSVCFFVCSGSEANELAIRLARTHTRREAILVMDGSYHGNTTTLIGMSPYKYKGPGGNGPSPWVYSVPCPDTYRGEFKRGNREAGKKYAAQVKDALNRIEKSGQEISAFICESLPSCGGQLVLPDHYLEEVYQAVRKSGGVCIADEVQVGFGRVGSHYWGFETQGVVPDIVTLGKSIGNGHPLAAVITTPEIADSFANGMEYFNTYGGNPVSCSIGLAVLDVIKEEGLRENARDVGNYLMEQLALLQKKLQGTYPVIGDVRGLGLFIGIELVQDLKTLEPAPDQASFVVERMRERGILVSSDGPFHNVIKIKPPLVFSRANADELVETLSDVLLSTDCYSK